MVLIFIIVTTISISLKKSLSARLVYVRSGTHNVTHASRQDKVISRSIHMQHIVCVYNKNCNLVNLKSNLQ